MITQIQWVRNFENYMNLGRSAEVLRGFAIILA